VSVDSAALPSELVPIIAPIATRVTFLDGDSADKAIPIVFLADPQPGDEDLPNHLPGDGEADDDASVDLPGPVGASGGGSARVASAMVAPHTVSSAIAAAEAESAPLTVSLSGPTGGAGLGSPSSVSISVAIPPTTTPVDGGSGSTGSSGSTTGGTTTPGAALPGTSTKNSTGTTSPVGGGRSLASTGVDAMLPFMFAVVAAIVGLASMLLVRRRRLNDMS
jgi:LPXTG-motif cell wall-anchored protein